MPLRCLGLATSNAKTRTAGLSATNTRKLLVMLHAADRTALNKSALRTSESKGSMLRDFSAASFMRSRM